MDAVMFLVLVSGIGAACVVGFAQLLQQVSHFSRLRTRTQLVYSHTLIVCGFLAVAPLYIVAVWGSPYGDVYPLYVLIPGIHIYNPANVWFDEVAFPWLLGYMESFPASVICVVIGPGVVGLLVGGLQWYLLGAVWERLTGTKSGAGPRNLTDA